MMVRSLTSRGTVFAVSWLLWAAPHSAVADEKVRVESPAEPPPDARWLSLKSDDHEREGDEYRRRRDWKECGRSMLAAAETSPENPRHASRLVTAAECFQKARLVGQALKARLSLISTHPTDPRVRDALFDVAAGYHQLAYYSKAAACYEAFATAFPRDKRAAKALATVKEFSAAVNGDADDCIPNVDLSVVRGRTQSGDRRKRMTPP